MKRKISSVATVNDRAIMQRPGIHTPHSAHDSEPTLSWFSALTTYLGYAVLIAFGHLRDFFAKRTGYSRYFGANSRPPKVWI